MINFAKTHMIKEPNEWGKYSYNTIVKCGGNFILKYYGGSLFLALKSIFPGSLIISINLNYQKLFGRKNGSRNVFLLGIGWIGTIKEGSWKNFQRSYPFKILVIGEI